MQTITTSSSSLKGVVFFKMPPDLQKEIVRHLSPYDLLGRFGSASKDCRIVVKKSLLFMVKLSIEVLTQDAFTGLREFAWLNLKVCSFNPSCSQQVNWLNQLTQIRQLDLFGTDFADIALPGMAAALTQLGKLDIRGTKITYAGREYLKNIHPNIEISAWVDQ